MISRPSTPGTAMLLCMALLLPWNSAFAQKAPVLSVHHAGRVVVPQAPAGPAASRQRVDEVEPNNTAAEAQVLMGASPLTLNGNAEVSDEGDLIISFQDGTRDDLEDLFLVTTTSAGLKINLDGLAADCDLYLINATADTVRAASLQVGVLGEEIDEPTLPVGTYFIGVSIFDPQPGAANATSYTLTVTGSITDDTGTALEAGDGLPTAFALDQNYPNPFNPETRIAFALPFGGAVRLEIFDLLGRKVKTLVDEARAAGVYTTLWDGTTDTGAAAATGVYVYRLQAGSFKRARTLVLLR